jgi:putative Mg2+ transporter-C (MgtC) family protein
MLSLEQMLIRFAVALVLGAILGLERELVGKETGIRTEMLVASGAAIFTIIGIALPYLALAPLGIVPDGVAAVGGFGVISSIVVGIGFLGAGLIVKDGARPHNLTTAALVWATAAIGILAGLGLFAFAGIVTAILAVLLFVIRRLNISEEFERKTENI